MSEAHDPTLVKFPAPTLVKTRPSVMNTFPGSIAYVSKDGAHYPGCKMASVWAWHMNAWARSHPFHLVVWMERKWGRVHFLYTKTLKDEQIAKLTRFQQGWDDFERREADLIASREAEAQEALAKVEKEQADKAKAEKDELTRLADLGRKCEQNHRKVK